MNYGKSREINVLSVKYLLKWGNMDCPFKVTCVQTICFALFATTVLLVPSHYHSKNVFIWFLKLFSKWHVRALDVCKRAVCVCKCAFVWTYRHMSCLKIFIDTKRSNMNYRIYIARMLCHQTLIHFVLLFIKVKSESLFNCSISESMQWVCIVAECHFWIKKEQRNFNALNKREQRKCVFQRKKKYRSYLIL